MNSNRRLWFGGCGAHLLLLVLGCSGFAGCGEERQHVITRISEAVLAYDPAHREQGRTLNGILGKEPPAIVVEAIGNLCNSRDPRVRTRAAAALGSYEQTFDHREDVRRAVLPLARRLFADADDQMARYGLMALTSRESAPHPGVIAARIRTARDSRLIETGATMLAAQQAWDMLRDDVRGTVSDMASPENERSAKDRLRSLLYGMRPGIENAPPAFGTVIAGLVSVTGVGREAILCLKRMPTFDAIPLLEQELRSQNTFESRTALLAATAVLQVDPSGAEGRLVEMAALAVDEYASGKAAPDNLKLINAWLAFVAARRSDAELLRRAWSLYESLGLPIKAQLLEDMCMEFSILVRGCDPMVAFLSRDVPRSELVQLAKSFDTGSMRSVPMLLAWN